jgi:branched-chain amino acid transport system permease protein
MRASVTLGLMNFVNLAHGAFAMAGGYITVITVNRLGLPFLARCRSRSCSPR